MNFCFQCYIYKNINIAEPKLAKSEDKMIQKSAKEPKMSGTAARQSTKSESKAGCAGFAQIAKEKRTAVGGAQLQLFLAV